MYSRGHLTIMTQTSEPASSITKMNGNDLLRKRMGKSTLSKALIQLIMGPMLRQTLQLIFELTKKM